MEKIWQNYKLKGIKFDKKKYKNAHNIFIYIWERKAVWDFYFKRFSKRKTKILKFPSHKREHGHRKRLLWLIYINVFG